MIADALLEQGLDVPDDLLPADVWPVAEPYRRAFAVLSASRGKGVNGADAIEYSEIVTYAEKNGYADTITDLEEFVSLIQVQDGALLDEAAKKVPAT